MRSLLILEVIAERLNRVFKMLMSKKKKNAHVKEDKKLELGPAKVEGPGKHSRFWGWVPEGLNCRSKGETEVNQSLQGTED